MREGFRGENSAGLKNSLGVDSEGVQIKDEHQAPVVWKTSSQTRDTSMAGEGKLRLGHGPEALKAASAGETEEPPACGHT